MSHEGRYKESARPATRALWGFTLIELLVVVAIVALLMAVLLPTVQRVRKQAKAAVCLSHLKQWGTTFALYTEENEGRFPREGYAPTDHALVSILSGLWIRDGADPNQAPRLYPVRTEGISCCPMAVRVEGPVSTSSHTVNGQTWLTEKIHGSTFTAWERLTAPRFRASYGLNKHVFSFVFDVRPDWHARITPYTDVVSIEGRSRIPVLLDSVEPSCCLILESRAPPKTEPSGYGGEVCINRHNGTINGLFLDWSVRQIGLKELWTLKWHPQWDAAGPWTKAGGVKPEDWPQWMRKFKDY